MTNSDFSAEVLALANAVDMRRFSLWETVIVPDDFCVGCECRTGHTTGQIVGFEGTSQLEGDGLIGPFYLVDVDHVHNNGGRLVYAESELRALGETA